jgi:hypothetical protein
MQWRLQSIIKQPKKGALYSLRFHTVKSPSCAVHKKQTVLWFHWDGAYISNSPLSLIWRRLDLSMIIAVFPPQRIEEIEISEWLLAPVMSCVTGGNKSDPFISPIARRTSSPQFC